MRPSTSVGSPPAYGRGNTLIPSYGRPGRACGPPGKPLTGLDPSRQEESPSEPQTRGSGPDGLRPVRRLSEPRPGMAWRPYVEERKTSVHGETEACKSGPFLTVGFWLPGVQEQRD